MMNIKSKKAKAWDSDSGGEEDLGTSAKKKKAVKKLETASESYDYALNLLSYRDYSEAELEARLKRQGATDAIAQATVAKLVNYGLIKEERYAERVYASWLQKRYYGKAHLAAELQKHQLKPELQLEVLASFTSQAEQVHAEAAAQLFLERNRKKLEVLSQSDNPKDKQKLYAAGARFMAARGFSARYMAVLMDKLYINNDI